MKQTKIYHIRGMHCASCELLIEKRCHELSGVVRANAVLTQKILKLECENSLSTIDELNSLFPDGRYSFSENAFDSAEKKTWFRDIFIVSFVLIVFFLLTKYKFDSLIGISAYSSLPVYFVFGIIAGFSTCAALIGGLVLGLSKQWNESVAHDAVITKKILPHVLFNGGRLISFLVAGFLLGWLGEKFQVSLTVSGILTLLISGIMIILGLQMLGVGRLSWFKISLPKNLTAKAHNHSVSGKLAPLITGALTIFLPCGFTLSAESAAILAKNPFIGAIIMFLFALGTSLPLLLIGFASVKFYENKKAAFSFSRVAGLLVIFFALFNINLQLTVLDFPRFDFFSNKTISTGLENGLAPVVDGKQLLQMAVGEEYFPNYFKVKVGIPVRWEIDGQSALGCTAVLVARKLFSEKVEFSQTAVTVKEFTPTVPGNFTFSCPMGMINGMLEVVP